MERQLGQRKMNRRGGMRAKFGCGARCVILLERFSQGCGAGSLVAAMAEVVGAFLRMELGHDLAEQVPQIIHRAGFLASQEPLHFCKCQFNGVEVRTVGRQIEETGADRFDGLSHANNFVSRQVIHHNDVARPKSRNKVLLDVSQKETAIYRSIDSQRRDQSFVTQPG